MKVGSSAMRNVCYIAELPPREIICYIAKLPGGRSAMGEGLLYNTGTEGGARITTLRSFFTIKSLFELRKLINLFSQAICISIYS